MSAAVANVYTDQWERTMEHGGFAVRATRVGAAAGAQQLGAALYELDPGKRHMPYHAHYGIEEMIVVLRGTPTLRTPVGERELAEGEVVACPAGARGAHQLINHSGSVARFMIVSTKAQADLIEYPDSGKITARGGDWDDPDAVTYRLSTEHQLSYFDGEPS